MANTPKIRFKNFSDEWVEKKFSDIAQTRRGLTYKPLDIRINGIRVLRSSNINEDKFIFDNTDVFVTKKAINIDYVKNGDILITSANGSSHLVGKHAIIKNLPDKSAVHGGFMLLVTANNTEFLNASMGSAWYQKFISLFVSGGNGAIGNLNQNDLNNACLPIPNSEEQEKIGAFFSKLDKLIALHQSKFEKLQKIKKSCLQNLFPQNNQNTPKIRFKNFSDEWENNNLGEICKIIKGEQINKLSLLENGKYYVLNGGISPSGYINTYNTLENTISISEGGNSCGYVKFNIEKFWSGGHNYTLNELKTKTLFLYSFLKAKQQKIMALRVGSGLPNIQKNTLSNISISIPNKKEQEKIGAFFSKLDKLITLHQSKFEKLQKIKKSCLQNMFV